MVVCEMTTAEVVWVPVLAAMPQVEMAADTEKRGVVGMRCGCCGETVISINRSAWNGEPLFCEACMALPETEAEVMIVAREASRLAAGLPVVELLEG